MEHFLRSSSHLILAQIFEPFDCLLYSWCNFSYKFSTIGLNSCLKFSSKVLSIYLSQEILIFSCKVQFLDKYGACFLVQDFIYFNESFVEEMLFLTFVSWKSNFFSIWVFFYDHARITGLQGKGEGIFLSPHYHFHPLHRHFGISRVINAEGSPLHIGSSRTRTGNLWFLSASR